MTDTGTMTLGNFEPCLGQTFRVMLEGANGPELELIQVKPLTAGTPQTGVRQPFSLLFRGPLEPVLAQNLMRIDSTTLGELSLFLVPIGPDDEGMLYDATFN